MRKLFSKEERSLYAAHAPARLELDDLAILSTASSSQSCGCIPTTPMILELSTKCLPSEAFQVAAETRASLTSGKST